MDNDISYEYLEMINRINSRMNKYNISYNDISNVTGHNYNSIYRFLKGNTAHPKLCFVIDILNALNVEIFKIDNVLGLDKFPSKPLNIDEIKKVNKLKNRLIAYYKIRLNKANLTSKEVSQLVNYDYTSLSRSLNRQTIDFMLFVDILRILGGTYSELLWVCEYINHYPYNNEYKGNTSIFEYIENEIASKNVETYDFGFFINKIEGKVYIINERYLTDEFLLLCLNYLAKSQNKNHFDYQVKKSRKNIGVDAIKYELTIDKYHPEFINLREILRELENNKILRNNHFVFFYYLNYMEYNYYLKKKKNL